MTDSLNFLNSVTQNCFKDLAALAQMVACLPLVQQVRGSIPGGVVNFNLKVFNLGAGRGGDVGEPGSCWHNFLSFIFMRNNKTDIIAHKDLMRSIIL